MTRLLDPSSASGESFEIGRSPRCPRGHGFEPVVLLGPAEPTEVRRKTVPLLGHTKWDAMSEAERKAVIERGIADYRRVEAERSRRSEDLAERSEMWRRRQRDSG